MDQINCPKCNYDFGDNQYNFCPKCGKKVQDPKNQRVTFRRVDFIRFCDGERFSEIWKQISPLDENGAYKWLQEAQDDISAFVIQAEYDYAFTDCKGCHHGPVRRTSDWVSVSEAKNMLLRSDTYTNCTFYPKQVNLRYNTSPYSLGSKFWWTKEECDAAIDVLRTV